MARREGRSDDFELGEVCTKCLEADPRNKSLLRMICMNKVKHNHGQKTMVWWREEKSHLEVYDESMPGKIPPIRPMPFAKFEGKFWLCDRSRCWRDKCRFAHSIEEREVWNARKFPSNDISPRSKLLAMVYTSMAALSKYSVLV